MKKKTIIIITLSIIFGGILCFSLGWISRNKYFDDYEVEYYFELDSIKQLFYLREESQSLFYQKTEEEVLAVLPTPKSDSKGRLFDDGNIDNWHWLLNPYKNRLAGTKDTLYMHTYTWVIPYRDRPNIYIVFEKDSNQWIATACVEWDPDVVQF
ncbi:MAG: hypothetical protein LBR36_06135 [Bacteroidales bacterium]|jgi:hypothetical protein|nr:hypothetical protein [Bacteroidales bacterium]